MKYQKCASFYTFGGAKFTNILSLFILRVTKEKLFLENGISTLDEMKEGVDAQLTYKNLFVTSM